MAKPYQNLLDIMAQLLVEQSEPMCRQVAGVFQRFVPEAGSDLQNMINDHRYGQKTASLSSESAVGSELIMSEAHFSKKKSTGVVVTPKPQPQPQPVIAKEEPIIQKSSQPSTVHTNTKKPEPVEGPKLPTQKLKDVDALAKHFEGMSLKDIKAFMNHNGVPIISTAKAAEVLEVLNSSIK